MKTLLALTVITLSALSAHAQSLIDIGYTGQVGLEYEINPKNPLPGMIESMAYMRGVLAALT